MQPARIAELLKPFLGPHNESVSSELCHSEKRSEKECLSSNHCHSEERSDEESAVLSPSQLQSISTYIDLLLRWNTHINLTAIRDPEQIVTRHFGESLFAARHLFPRVPPMPSVVKALDPARTLADIGSGPGFPGLPIKLWAPQISLTLIESNHKKAIFLREVTRALRLTGINIQTSRAQDLLRDDLLKKDLLQKNRLDPNLVAAPENQSLPKAAPQERRDSFDVVTLRAVERFADILPAAAALTAPGGRLALLIGSSQENKTITTLAAFEWLPPIPIPLSKSRLLLIGTNRTSKSAGTTKVISGNI